MLDRIIITTSQADITVHPTYSKVIVFVPKLTLSKDENKSYCRTLSRRHLYTASRLAEISFNPESSPTLGFYKLQVGRPFV